MLFLFVANVAIHIYNYRSEFCATRLMLIMVPLPCRILVTSEH